MGADSANLAYRKDLFFDNKGFCETLNLNYGDDDIFISEIARDHIVTVDLTPDSIVTLHEDTPARIYDLERSSRSFTQSKLRRIPFILSGFQDLLWWIWLIASVAGIICTLPSLMGAVCILLIAAVLIIPVSVKWRKAARVLSLPAHTSILTFLSLANPIISLRYKMQFGKKARNYTWQN